MWPIGTKTLDTPLIHWAILQQIYAEAIQCHTRQTLEGDGQNVLQF